MSIIKNNDSIYDDDDYDDDDEFIIEDSLPSNISPSCYNCNDFIGRNSDEKGHDIYLCRLCNVVYLKCPNCHSSSHATNTYCTEFHCNKCSNSFTICSKCNSTVRKKDVESDGYTCEKCNKNFYVCPHCGYYATKNGRAPARFKCKGNKKIRCSPQKCLVSGTSNSECKIVNIRNLYRRMTDFKQFLRDCTYYNYRKHGCEHVLSGENRKCKPESMELWKDCTSTKEECRLLVCTVACGKVFSSNFNKKKAIKREMERDAWQLKGEEKLSYREIASRLGTSKSTIGYLIKGRRRF